MNRDYFLEHIGKQHTSLAQSLKNAEF